jgi:RNA polymerase sigma-70 factor (ECF subfamily)
VNDRREQLERLYERFAADIAMYALRRADRETAQDVVAETFLVAWRRIRDVPAEPLPWLYGVARRVLANQRRASSRRQALRESLRASTAGVASPPADLGLAEALRELSDNDREVLMLIAWEGLTTREAAVALGCSDTACRLRLHRARRRLASLLADAFGGAVQAEEAR